MGAVIQRHWTRQPLNVHNCVLETDIYVRPRMLYWHRFAHDGLSARGFRVFPRFVFRFNGVEVLPFRRMALNL